jgi:hypothetical protein
MADVLSALVAFVAEHQRCGDLDGGKDNALVWLGRSIEADRQREFCVGEGAHTHYWDGWGAGIARELDDVMARALADASGRHR